MEEGPKINISDFLVNRVLSERETVKISLVEKNYLLEIFTEEMYLTFEQRLVEWREQNEKIKTQQELFNAKEKGLNDVVEIMTEQSEHYKNQFEKLF